MNVNLLKNVSVDSFSLTIEIFFVWFVLLSCRKIDCFNGFCLNWRCLAPYMASTYIYMYIGLCSLQGVRRSINRSRLDHSRSFAIGACITRRSHALVCLATQIKIRTHSHAVAGGVSGDGAAVGRRVRGRCRAGSHGGPRRGAAALAGDHGADRAAGAVSRVCSVSRSACSTLRTCMRGVLLS